MLYQQVTQHSQQGRKYMFVAMNESEFDFRVNKIRWMGQRV